MRHTEGIGRRSLIHRALDVLGSFTPGRPELTLTGISRAAGLPMATAHRLVAELVAWGALERGANGGYHLTVKVWELGAAAEGTATLGRAAMPSLSELSRLTRRPAALAVLDDGDVVVVASIGGGTAGAPPAARHPARTTAAGLALLAHQPWPVRERAVRDDPAPGALRRALADARRCGVAVSPAAATPGTTIAAATAGATVAATTPGTTVAAVVRDATGAVVAAVTTTAGRAGEAAHLVRGAAAEISARLGHRGRPACPRTPMESGHLAPGAGNGRLKTSGRYGR